LLVAQGHDLQLHRVAGVERGAGPPTARNLANRLALQTITWGGTPNLWEGPVNPPRTVFFKIAYAH
jgi:hypothetical protein